MASIRIVSDGTAAGTLFLDANGDALTGVVSFKIEADANDGSGLVRAHVEFVDVSLDVTAEPV